MTNTVSYEMWLQQLKDLGGYYEQPDETFYPECYYNNLTPQQVTDYLNSPVDCSTDYESEYNDFDCTGAFHNNVSA